jgi:tRNA-specific 2-thiouridylase
MKPNSETRVVVGMSGGVDSTVATLLLKEQGYDVHGLFMTNWEDDEEGYCQAAADLHDAHDAADQIGVPFHRVNFAREYRERVFDYFLREYKAGRTPNPDVLCNREIKFGVCFDYAQRLGARYIATGHYARTTGDGRLLLAEDESKDQTYFLNGIDAKTLRRTKFPLGDLAKTEVRKIADRNGFRVHDKPDSTGICFIGERRFREFLSRYIPAQPGPIQDDHGHVLGEHQGLMFYTIGQRQGLGIGGRKGAADAPWYVATKRISDNALIVVQGHNHPLLLSDSLIAEPAHWISGQSPRLPFHCRVRIRHRQAMQHCRVDSTPDGLRVSFDKHQRAISPGQFVVFYRDEVCLGGSVIVGALPTDGSKEASICGNTVFAA